MVAVTANEVGPIASGIVYCAVVLECMQLFDLKRAAEWTDALGAWCDAQPDLVPYRGQCLVHQSQLQQAAGDWPDAISSAEAACRRLTDPPHPALGLAHYQEGELHRLVGAFEQAEVDYRQASRHGYDPVPGLALLQLGARRRQRRRRGDPARAARGAGPAWATGAAGRRSRHPLRRRRAGRGPLGRRRTGGDRRRVGVEWRARRDGRARAPEPCSSARAIPQRALPQLRAAATTWKAMRMPYEAASTGIQVGLACSALGDRTDRGARVRQRQGHLHRTGRGTRPGAGDGGCPRRPRQHRHHGRRGRATDRRGDVVEPRARSTHPSGRGPDQSGDRRATADQPAHRRPAPGEHLRQAGGQDSRRGDRVRLRTRSRLVPWRPWGVRPSRRAWRNGSSGRCPAVERIRTVDGMTTSASTATLDRRHDGPAECRLPPLLLRLRV